MASGSLCGQSLYLLPVQLGSSAVVLGVGSVCRTPMLTKESHLGKKKQKTHRCVVSKCNTVQKCELRRSLQGLTALAFPPTCIHRSWNQDQLKSSSVDLYHTQSLTVYTTVYMYMFGSKLSVTDMVYIYLIKDRCTPRDLCVPEQSIHTKTP